MDNVSSYYSQVSSNWILELLIFFNSCINDLILLQNLVVATLSVVVIVLLFFGIYLARPIKSKGK